MDEQEMRRHESRLREVARLHWMEGCSQSDIARRQLLSRTTVSRLLEEARRRGIIRLRLAEPHDRDDDLEAALVRRWLDRGHRVDVRVALQFNRNVAEDDRIVGRIAARAVADRLAKAERRTVAIASSRTVAQVLPFAEIIGRLERVSELLGVSSRRVPLSAGAELARSTGAVHDAIDAPFVHRDVERARAARTSVELVDALSRARQVPVALIGANAMQRFDGTGAYAPVSTAILSEAERGGAVGHVCGWFLNAEGTRVPTSLDDLRLGIEPADFRSIPHRILLCWGADKASIVEAAVSAGLCTGVATDAATARSILGVGTD